MKNETIEERYKRLKVNEAKIKEEIEKTKEELIEIFAKEPDHDFNGLTIHKSMGRKTIGWKAIAEILKPSNDLVDRYTKIGEPTFSVRLKESKE